MLKIIAIVITILLNKYAFSAEEIKITQPITIYEYNAKNKKRENLDKLRHLYKKNNSIIDEINEIEVYLKLKNKNIFIIDEIQNIDIKNNNNYYTIDLNLINNDINQFDKLKFEYNKNNCKDVYVNINQQGIIHHYLDRYYSTISNKEFNNVGYYVPVKNEFEKSWFPSLIKVNTNDWIYKESRKSGILSKRINANFVTNTDVKILLNSKKNISKLINLDITDSFGNNKLITIPTVNNNIEKFANGDYGITVNLLKYIEDSFRKNYEKEYDNGHDIPNVYKINKIYIHFNSVNSINSTQNLQDDDSFPIIGVEFVQLRQQLKYYLIEPNAITIYLDQFNKSIETKRIKSISLHASNHLKNPACKIDAFLYRMHEKRVPYLNQDNISDSSLFAVKLFTIGSIPIYYSDKIQSQIVYKDGITYGIKLSLNKEVIGDILSSNSPFYPINNDMFNIDNITIKRKLSKKLINYENLFE